MDAVDLGRCPPKEVPMARGKLRERRFAQLDGAHVPAAGMGVAADHGEAVALADFGGNLFDEWQHCSATQATRKRPSGRAILGVSRRLVARPTSYMPHPAPPQRRAQTPPPMPSCRREEARVTRPSTESAVHSGTPAQGHGHGPGAAHVLPKNGDTASAPSPRAHPPMRATRAHRRSSVPADGVVGVVGPPS